MRKLALLLLLLTLPAMGETFYVSSAGGSTSCGGDGTQTTQAATFFNTAANWANPKVAGKIGPGDTANLCGTFTGTANGPALLTAQASGSSGSLITIRWESNALITSPACGTNGCIYGNGQKFLIFDGNGTNPSITNTANGSALANQIDTAGISAVGCDNCEFKNLAITNIYQHSSTSDTTNGSGGGVLTDGTAVLFHGNTCDQMYICFNYPPNSKNVSGTQVYSNTISHINWAVYINGNGTSAISNTLIHDNHISNYSNWDTTNDAFHHDGVFVVHNGSGSITNTYVYNNKFDGVGSTCSPNSCMTANVFVNTHINGMYIFNNINLTTSANAYIEGGSPDDANYVIENNYFDAGGSCIQVQGIAGITIVNNAFNGCFTYILTSSVTGTVSVDYNAYDSAGSNTGQAFKWNGNLGGDSFTAYRAANPTLDVHSITPVSLGETNGMPNAGSAMIHDGTTKFSNLTASCTGNLTALCTAANGLARPNTAFAWDVGAYQYVSAPTVTITTPTAGATISGPSVSLSGTCVPTDAGTVSTVQFALDGTNTGAQGATSPYSISFDSTLYSNATHVLSFTCNDSGSGTGSSNENVVISNGGSGVAAGGAGVVLKPMRRGR